MRLKTRIVLITLSACLLMVGIMAYFGEVRDQADDQLLAQLGLDGQDALWRHLTELSAQRLDAVATRPEVTAAIAQGDFSTLSVPVDRYVAQWQIISAKGELLFASSGAMLDAPLVNVAALPSAANGVMLARSVLRSDGELVAIVAVAANVPLIFADFKRLSGNDIFLINPVGRVSIGTNPDLWPVVVGEDFFSLKRRWQIVQRGARFFAVTVLPLDGAESGAVVAVRDITVSRQQRDELHQQEVRTIVTALVVFLLVAAFYLRSVLVPLTQSATVLRALAQGDVSRTVVAMDRQDEVTQLAESVRQFRDQAEKQLAQERQRFRQEMFIRLEMRHLAEMLTDEARQAVLTDLSIIENSSLIDGMIEGTQTARSDLEGLVKAFETMSTYIREHSSHLDRVISEQVRDVQALRDALHAKTAPLTSPFAAVPRILPSFPGRNEFVHYAEQRRNDGGSGDLYDFFLVDPHQLGFVIGHADGAVVAGVARRLVAAMARIAVQPGECLALVNAMMVMDAPLPSPVSLFFGVLDVETGQVRFCNAGHLPPLIVRGNGQVDALCDVAGPAIGVAEAGIYETGSFTLSPDDSIVLYTQGQVDAARDGLIDTLKVTAKDGPEGLVRRLLAVGVVGTVLSVVLDHLFTPHPAEGQRLDTTIANDVAELERLSAIVDAFVAQHNLPNRLAFNLNLSLDELITNIVSFGFLHGEAHDILVSLRIEDGFLITEIVDDGMVINPFKPVAQSESSLGGVLVQSVLSRTNYERLGEHNVTTIWQSLSI